MKKLKEELKYGNKGITLISLVVTIIVLLILAGVSIATLTSENGILTRVNEAKKKTEEANDIEKIKLAISEAQIEKNGYEKINFQNFQEALNSQFGDNNVIVVIDEEGTFTVSCLDTLIDYTISENQIEKKIDWNKAMLNAVAPESQDEVRNEGVIAIGTDGNPVDMDLWEYTFDDETGGYALNSEKVINGGGNTAGYRGIVKDDGTIEGTVPQYIKVNNGEWIPVTSLYRTFQGNDTTNEQLKKLTIAPKIPITVKSMKMTFEYCEKLTEISCIPGSVKKLIWTFDGYTALKKMPQIGYGVEDMLGAFSGCSELTELSVLPNTVKNLQSTFGGCESLQEVPNIPDSVTNMSFTFIECIGLRNIRITIPKSVTNMQQTFWRCTGLSYIEITIPENVTNIQQTFSECINLESTIIVNCNPEVYVNFLQNTIKPIILKGKSNMLNQIREGRSNVTVLEE